jgi:hypothetical protein
MELILESPVGVSIKVRKPNYKQQAKFLSTMFREDRSHILVDIAEYIALNCTDTDYISTATAEKYGVDILETQSTTEMATEALINRYSFGMISLWAESLLEQLGLTDESLNRMVEEEKNSSAPAELSP